MSEGGQGIEYAEVVLRAPLWRTIPKHERVTEEMVLAKFGPDAERPASSPGPWAPFVAERYIARLRDPGCEVAVQLPEFGRRWIPCAGDTGGHARCKRHGGPGVGTRATRATRISELEAEVARLRAQLSEGNS